MAKKVARKSQKRPAAKAKASSKPRVKKNPTSRFKSVAPRPSDGTADRTILFQCIDGRTTVTPDPTRMQQNQTVVLVAVNKKLTLTFQASEGSPFKRTGLVIELAGGESSIETVHPKAPKKKYHPTADLDGCTETQGPPEMIVE